jgi:hypothetical protein
MATWADGAPVYQQRRVSIRLSAADWQYLDQRIKLTGETDDHNLTWVLRRFVEEQRTMDTLRARASLALAGEASDA